MVRERHVLVMYDIGVDQRRTRVHALLNQYLTPIQESVFEGLLTVSELHAIRELLAKRIVPDQDKITIFHLSGSSPAAEDLGLPRPRLVKQWFWIV